MMLNGSGLPAVYMTHNSSFLINAATPSIMSIAAPSTTLVSHNVKQRSCKTICGPDAIERSLKKKKINSYSLIPNDASCAFHYNSSTYAWCLSGKWLLMLGSSNINALAQRFSAFAMSHGRDLAFPLFNDDMSNFDFIVYKNGSHSIYQKIMLGLRNYSLVPEEMARGFAEINQFWDIVDQRTEPFSSRVTLVSDRWLQLSTYLLQRLRNNSEIYNQIGLKLITGFNDVWYHICAGKSLSKKNFALCGRSSAEITSVYNSELALFLGEVKRVISSGAVSSMFLLTMDRTYALTKELVTKLALNATTVATPNLFGVGDMFQMHPSGTKALYIFTAFMSTICAFKNSGGCAQEPLFSTECTAKWLKQKSVQTRDVKKYKHAFYKAMTYNGCRWYESEMTLPTIKPIDVSASAMSLTPAIASTSETTAVINSNCKLSCGPAAIERPLKKKRKNEYYFQTKDAECVYHFNNMDYVNCLAGRWILVIGASNMDIISRRFAAYMMSQGRDLAFPAFNTDMSHFDFILYKNGTHSIYQKRVFVLHNYSRVPEEMARAFTEVDTFWNVVDQRTEPFITRVTLISDRWLIIAIHFLQWLADNRERYVNTGMNLVTGFNDVWYHLCSQRRSCSSKTLNSLDAAGIWAVYESELNFFLKTVAIAISSGAVSSMFLVTMDRTYPVTQRLAANLALNASRIATPNLFGVGDMFQMHPSGTKALYIFAAFMSTICGFRNSVGCAQKPMFSPECTAKHLKKISVESKDMRHYTQPFYKAVTYHGCSWFGSEEHSDLSVLGSRLNKPSVTEQTEGLALVPKNNSSTTPASSSITKHTCSQKCGPDIIEQSLRKNEEGSYNLESKDTSCVFHYNSSDYTKCLTGRWILMVGGSDLNILARRFSAFVISQGRDLSFPVFIEDMSHFDFILYKNGSHSIYQHSNLEGRNYSRAPKEMARAHAELDQFWDIVDQRTEPFSSRVTLVSDRWLLAGTYSFQRLTNNKKQYSKSDMSLITGSNDNWYQLCSQQKFCHSMLNNLNSSEITSVYNSELALFLGEVKQVISIGAVSSMFLLTMDRTYALTKELVTKLALNATTVATPNLFGVGDMFQMNPSGTKALYIFTAFMSTICAFKNSGGCAQEPLFSTECTAKWLKQKSIASGDLYRYTDAFYKSATYSGCRWYGRGDRKIGLLTNGHQTSEHYSAGLVKYPISKRAASTYISANTLALFSAIVLAFAIYSKYSSIRKTDKAPPLDLARVNEFDATLTEPIKSSSPPLKTELIDSMYFCRYLASFHVVAGHLHAKGHTLIPGAGYFLSWGFTWVPFFFVLSGFVLALAKLKNDGFIATNIEPTHVYVWKRLCNIYPLYYVALALSAFMNYASKSPSLAAENASTIALEIFLLQSWVPNIIEDSVQAHCWFLSCEVFYWIIFSSLLKIVNKLTHGMRLFYFIMCAFVIPHMFAMFPHVVFGLGDHWYSSHKTGRMTKAIDALAVTLKFYPLSYVHDFFLGVLLAYLTKTYMRYSTSKKVESYGTISKKILCLVIENGMSIGYILLGAIFYFPSLRPYDHKMSCRLGLLSPLHSLILVSMAVRKDPLEKFFSHWLPKMLGEWSYCQFILQFVIYKIFITLTNTEVDETAFQFWLFLTAFSYLTYIVIQKPLKSPSNFEIFMQFWLPTAIAWSFVLGTNETLLPNSLFFAELLGKHSSHQATPLRSVAFVKRNFGSYDARLNLSFGDNNYGQINPSIIQGNALLPQGSYLIAARKHYLESSKSTTKNGRKKIKYTYHSGITIGLLSADLKQRNSMIELRFSHSSSDSSHSSFTQWIPCQHIMQEFSKNKTIISVHSTGPEDPRILSYGKSIEIYFFSYLPVATPQACKAKGNIGTIFSSFIRISVKPTGALSVKTADPLPVDLHTNVSKVTLQHIEKNWLPFILDGYKHYVYSVLPHVVIDDKGYRYNGNSDVMKSRLGFGENAVINMVVHGGASPILATDVLIEAPWQNVSVFIASCHTSNPTAKQEYTHYLYAFTAKPPYDIIALSSPLELVDQPGKHSETFVSSLTRTHEGKYLLGYGSGDVESRVLMMSLEYIRYMFNFRK